MAIMLTENRLQDFAKVAIASLALATTVNSLPAYANTPMGTAHELEGTQARTADEWLGGVGGEYDETTLGDRPDYENQSSVFVERFKTINQHWRNAEQNVKRESEPFSDVHVPFVQF
jgi:hypothetical protein